MNKEVLLEAQRLFLSRYPGGFADPDLVATGKKFKMGQHGDFAREQFAESRFDAPRDIVEAMATLVSRSALVSMFEKPKFKAAASTLSPMEIEDWAGSLRQLLHGDQKTGFESLVAALSRHKLAKWTLVTVVPAYYDQQAEVFVKPSTAKLIIGKLALDLSYSATPTWQFYQGYREAVLKMRQIARDVKAPTNPSFTGFLMMTLDGHG
ncbi:hypothetical protein [uncultured Hoeflea sp.]|uniref:hypothetical protein n=1 Tax=uncultured Hoeflea sp. TaxID=538666 RepID=UPI0030ED5831|tara:strand:- start:73541 stop:74164 length:624 start_codon:yes stop_codon:yes gene_type:complete